MSRFEVSSKDSCAQASWFCKGVVWKTNLSYLLKKKEMIMAGIMGEDEPASFVPRYARPKGSQCLPPGGGDLGLPLVESPHWRGTRRHRGPSCSPAPVGRVGDAERRQHGD